MTTHGENGERRRHWYSVDVRELHPEDRLAVGARREISTERYELTGDGGEEPAD